MPDSGIDRHVLGMFRHVMAHDSTPTPDALLALGHNVRNLGSVAIDRLVLTQSDAREEFFILGDVQTNDGVE